MFAGRRKALDVVLRGISKQVWFCSVFDVKCPSAFSIPNSYVSCLNDYSCRSPLQTYVTSHRPARSDVSSRDPTGCVVPYSGRTLVFDRRTFRPALKLQLTGDHSCG